MNTNKKKDNFDYFNLLCEADEAEQKYEQLIKNGNHAPAKIKAAYSDVEKLNRQIKREGKKVDGIPERRQRARSGVSILILYYLSIYPNGKAQESAPEAPSFISWLGTFIANQDSIEGIDEVVWNDDGGITVFSANKQNGNSIKIQSISTSLTRLKKQLQQKNLN